MKIQLKKPQRRQRKKPKAIIVVVSCLLLVACSGKEDIADLVNYIAGLKTQSDQKQQEKSAEVPLTTPVQYTADKEGSPFQKGLEKGTGGDLNLHTPLQMFPIDMLQYIGLISQGKNIWAIIRTPDKKIYQISIGDKVGEKEGQVTRIEDDRVEVIEQVRDESGQTLPRVITLRLVDASKGQ